MAWPHLPPASWQAFWSAFLSSMQLHSQPLVTSPERFSLSRGALSPMVLRDLTTLKILTVNGSSEVYVLECNLKKYSASCFLNFCFIVLAANNSQQFITLSFRAMGTECSYDYVFVYDGSSFNSPLLGSFSGKTEPQQVTAVSGSVSVNLLFSLLSK